MARVLIVDDSPSQLMGMKKIMEKLGHEVISAEDGVNWVRSMAGSGLGNARAAGGYPAGRR